MNATTRTLLLAACLLQPAACTPAEQARTSAEQAASAATEALARTSRDVSDKVRRDLVSADIDVGKGDTKAKISAQGDLLIDGKAVPVDEHQRALLLAHRASIIAVAEAGLQVGLQGASLGTKAAGGALKAVFGGNAEEFGKQMEAEGQRIEAEAQKICDRLPQLLESQQALVAALPAFVPYATMDGSDVSGCHANGRSGNNQSLEAGRHDDSAPAQARDRAPSEDAAAEADNAAATPRE